MTFKTLGLLFLTLFSLVSIGSFAQLPFQQERRPRFPGWVSEKGYWVIESNIKSPLDHVVKFYDNENNLVYKESLTGIKMNPEKRKVKMKLKKILESAVLAQENRKDGIISIEETALVKSAFR
jgi:hypothetical protein